MPRCEFFGGADAFFNVKLQRYQLRIGLFFLGAVALLYLGLAWLTHSGVFRQGGEAYYLKFKDATGLVPGDAVTLYGVPAGNVESISLERGYALVQIRLQPNARLPKGTYAQLTLKEVLGGKQIALHAGGKPGFLAAGDTLATRPSLDFGGALTEANAYLRALPAERLDRLTRQTDSLLLAFNGIPVGKLSERLSAVITQFQQLGNQLSRTLHALQPEATRAEVVTSLRKGRALIARLDSFLLRAEPVVQAFPEVLRKGDSTLVAFQSTSGELEGTLVQLNTLLGRQHPEALAPRLLSDPSLAAEFESLLKELRELLRQAKAGELKIKPTLR